MAPSRDMALVWNISGIDPVVPSRHEIGRTEMTTRKQKSRKWSADVTENSDALDLEKDVFKSGSPAEIAHSLERSAERSDRRKSSPFRSAMSMLTFYINRAGKNLSSERKRKLEAAKSELRQIFKKKQK